MDYQESIAYFEQRMKLKEKEVQSENPDIKRADDKLMDIYKAAISAMQELQEYKQKLNDAYGECDDLLRTVVDGLVRHEGIEIGTPIKSRMLTDEDVDLWEGYKQIGTLEEVQESMQELETLHNQGISLERLKDIDFRKDVVEHINYYAYMELQDELEEYRKLGTLEELKKIKDYELSGIELAEIACSLKRLKDYQQIGALEEVREAVGKQKAKKPKRDYIYHHPTRWCEKCNSVVLSRWKYCPDCGQAIDWSVEE